VESHAERRFSPEDLVGVPLPRVDLDFLSGHAKSLASLAAEGALIIYTYPGIGWWADAPLVSDLDAAQAGDFRDYGSELADLGYRIVGVSTQPLGELRNWAMRERISHCLASDGDLRVADALGLPTVQIARVRVYDRLTLIVREGRITKAIYRVEQPSHAAGQVLSWLYQAEGRP